MPEIIFVFQHIPVIRKVVEQGLELPEAKSGCSCLSSLHFLPNSFFLEVKIIPTSIFALLIRSVHYNIPLITKTVIAGQMVGRLYDFHDRLWNIHSLVVKALNRTRFFLCYSE